MVILTKGWVLTCVINSSLVAYATHGDECQRHLYMRGAEYVGTTHVGPFRSRVSVSHYADSGYFGILVKRDNGNQSQLWDSLDIVW